MHQFRFLIFFGQFQTAGSFIPGPPEAEKLAGSSKKSRPIISRGTLFRAETKHKKNVKIFLINYLFCRMILVIFLNEQVHKTKVTAKFPSSWNRYAALHLLDVTVPKNVNKKIVWEKSIIFKIYMWHYFTYYCICDITTSEKWISWSAYSLH